MKILANPGAHLLLGQGIGAMRIEKMLAEATGFFLQLSDTESTNGLHKIGRNCCQQTHISLKWSWYGRYCTAFYLPMFDHFHPPIYPLIV
jgi:hypothetical protein